MVTTILTALGAILVFVVTQVFLKLVLEPVQAQRELIGEVAHALLFYANVYRVEEVEEHESMSEGRVAELEEARKALRKLTGRLRASLWTVPAYDKMAGLGAVPKREDVLEASTQLVGWSNSLYRESDDHDRRQTIIADRLGITKKLEPRRPAKTG